MTTPASSAVTVIGADNIEPWGATTTLPATGILGGMATGRDRILGSPEMFARAKALVAQGGQFRTWYDTIISRADLYLTDDTPATVAPTAAAGGTQPILAGLEDNLTFLAGAYKLRTLVEGTETNSQKYFDKAKAVIQAVTQWMSFTRSARGSAMNSSSVRRSGAITRSHQLTPAAFATASNRSIGRASRRADDPPTLHTHGIS